MQKFIVLFRGINVGKNLLPMKELVSILIKNQYESVSLYIQTGNVVLKSVNDPAENIQSIVSKNFGFTPLIITLNESAFSTSFLNNPYKNFEGKFVHFYFCEKEITLDQDKLDKYIAVSEEYQVKDNVFYLHVPEGIGRTKLVANIADIPQHF